MNYLSVCSGIEAATVAWHHMGWKPVGFSEIEKFPSQVLAHHYPQVTNFGDMTKYKEWQIDGTIGLLVGGTPCQSFSVAGLRKGLSDPRGNLALTYVGILDHFRPKWFVWENVPGVLSSGEGRDFAAFLTALGIIGYGWSYRVLDAQYFGVAQRRRRVFVVGHLGDWRPPAEVLFEPESLSGNTEKGRGKKQKTTRNVTYSVVYENHPSDSRVKEMGDVCQTVTSSWGTGGGNIPFVQNIAYGFEPGITKREGNPNRFCEEISPTLRAEMGDNQVSMANNMAVRRLTPIECERLQGFPYNYTNIKENCPDGARYKALGNSMAVPVMRWIGERINSYETMRSPTTVQVETGMGLAEV
jgi:DNA (cytosine-5)-methyltransferase 1